ncbi:hypothetical protein QQS21_007255 [Conoideocrella luteorostrata]|uniref:S-adenosyl-L-methionine-dependent methyltransferase n=1 Tax=Conoideocrella luteorostrata TaxID=1105319 RepID=A0AAJ0FZN0_9HYPO|nr:hypothetical protein QQS21_007255 [Conoideocrella luteorostrata]
MPHHIHHHGHHHHRPGSDNKSLGQRNKEHFDEVASTAFQTPWIAKIAAQVTEELQKNYAWIEEGRSNTRNDTKLLDYACGNGIVSRALAPYVKTCRGIDISSEMVSQYQKVVEEENMQDRLRAVQGDLLDMAATPSPELASQEYKDFDFAVMSLALHHVEDVEAMIAGLAERLGDGGVLVIVDWVAESESGLGLPLSAMEDNPVRHTVHHMGFTERELRAAFEKAGLESWGWKRFGKESDIPSELGGSQQGFLARGTKKVEREL